VAYWITSLVLIVVGFLGSFSIGQPFLLVGLAMLVLGVFRNRPLVFWPPMLAVIAYNIVYWAVAPFSCSASETVGGTSHTVCSSLIGLRFEGEGSYNPSLMPATLAGLLFAALVLVVAFALLWWNRRGRRNAAAS
jgi:hypothetical protein